MVARVVKNLTDWLYSSYQDYTGLRKGTLCAKEIFYALTGLNSEDIKNKTMEKIDEKILEKLF